MEAFAGRIVIFGGGNIGRSFIGQVFSRGGWEVVFVDVDSGLVAALNERRGYPVVVKRQGRPDETTWVRNVRAVDGRDLAAVAAELAGADLAATSVGKAALPHIVGAIAAGLVARGDRIQGAARAGVDGPAVRPLDLILAENDREAPETLRRALEAALPPGFPLAKRLGIVETSIGKMVPIMRAADLATDRLRVFSEAYNELIVDRRGFLGPLPTVPDLHPVDNILAYVDRKLFVHNLGHAAVAYLGRRLDPSATLICEALELPGVRAAARRAMTEAAAALAREYPADLAPAALEAHIEDLLGRFANAALGDTVYRVGRDLPRKLHRSDRIVGAALLCERHGLAWDAIADVFRAALTFDATDESGKPFPADTEARELLEREGIQAFLSQVCGLDGSTEFDARLRVALSE
jgi:mannitol-1-phosphate 5-dehydrogenase